MLEKRMGDTKSPIFTYGCMPYRCYGSLVIERGRNGSGILHAHAHAAHTHTAHAATATTAAAHATHTHTAHTHTAHTHSDLLQIDCELS